MRWLASSLLLLFLLLWAAVSGFRAESGRERPAMSAMETVDALPPDPEAARSATGRSQSGDRAVDLPRVRSVQWHRFLPGMFR